MWYVILGGALGFSIVMASFLTGVLITRAIIKPRTDTCPKIKLSAQEFGQGNVILGKAMIAYKAESAGRDFVKVDPRGTSQNCSHCGHKQVKALSERTHKCDSCGLVLDRDHNAAINILRAGIALVAPTCPIRESVAAEEA